MKSNSYVFINFSRTPIPGIEPGSPKGQPLQGCALPLCDMGLNGPGGNLTPLFGSGDRYSDDELQTLKITRNI